MATSATVRVAAVQVPARAFDTAASMIIAKRWIEDAASQGARLIVLPEAVLGGYPRGAGFGATVGARTAPGRALFGRYFANAVQVPGPETDQLCQVAARHGGELVIGVIERAGSTLYCSAVFISGTGHVRGVHPNMHATATSPRCATSRVRDGAWCSRPITSCPARTRRCRAGCRPGWSRSGRSWS